MNAPASNAIATPEQLAIEDVKRLANIVLGLRDQVFKIDLDYGVIPGTGTKPTLLLPGMEKLMRALHLRAEYVALSQIEDFDKNVIYYRYECRMIDYETGVCVSTAIGSANSRESKWRWRDQKRTCPKCGKETINRSKFAPKGAPQGTEPGWYCYAKAGGCGAEFAATDTAITVQTIGRIENPDIFDQMNTIDKIAQKRALASAIKGAANVSEFYTVDLEDFQQYDTSNVVQSSAIKVEREEPAPQPSRPATVSGAGVPPTTHTEPVAASADEGELAPHWDDDGEAWNSFLNSAKEKLTISSTSVKEALDKFDSLKIANWHTSKGWSLAAVIAYAKDYNSTEISAATLFIVQDPAQADKLNEMAQQIAKAVAPETVT